MGERGANGRLSDYRSDAFRYSRRSDVAGRPRERGHSLRTPLESCLLSFSGLTTADRDGGMVIVECVVRRHEFGSRPHRNSQPLAGKCSTVQWLTPRESHARDLFAIAARGSRSPDELSSAPRARVCRPIVAPGSRMMRDRTVTFRSEGNKFGPPVMPLVY